MNILYIGSETERTSNTMPDEDRGDDDDEADTFGVGKHMEAFNAVEMCIRYTERLLKDSTTAGGAVFGNDDSGAVKASTGTSNVLSSPATKQSSALSPSLDTDKLRLCKESFETAKSAFNQALKQGMDKLVVSAQGIFKDVLTQTLGRHGPFGGVRFDLADDKFEMQPALPLLPRALVSPLETLLEVCAFIAHYVLSLFMFTFIYTTFYFALLHVHSISLHFILIHTIFYPP